MRRRSQWPCAGKRAAASRRTVAAGAAAVVARRTAVPFRVDRSAIGRYLGADRRTYHLVTSHLTVDAETSFARRPRYANHGLSQRYQPTVYATICVYIVCEKPINNRYFFSILINTKVHRLTTKRYSANFVYFAVTNFYRFRSYYMYKCLITINNAMDVPCTSQKYTIFFMVIF